MRFTSAVASLASLVVASLAIAMFVTQVQVSPEPVVESGYTYSSLSSVPNPFTDQTPAVSTAMDGETGAQFVSTPYKDLSSVEDFDELRTRVLDLETTVKELSSQVAQFRGTESAKTATTTESGGQVTTVVAQQPVVRASYGSTGTTYSSSYGSTGSSYSSNYGSTGTSYSSVSPVYYSTSPQSTTTVYRRSGLFGMRREAVQVPASSYRTGSTCRVMADGTVICN